jgi:hypothetical protein
MPGTEGHAQLIPWISNKVDSHLDENGKYTKDIGERPEICLTPRDHGNAPAGIAEQPTPAR